MPVRKCLLAGIFLTGLISPGTGHARPSRSTGQTTASQQALDKAKRERDALLLRRASQNSVITRQKAAQAKALQDASLQAKRAQRFSTLSEQAKAELETTESQVRILTQDIAALQTQQMQQREALARRRASLQAILPVALRLSRYPATSLLALSNQADDAVQGLSIIAGLTQLTERQTNDLHAQQVLLEQTAEQLSDRQSSLADMRTRLASLRDSNIRRMNAATEQQEEAEARARQAKNDIAAATAQAATLDDALSAIEKTRSQIRARMDAEAQALIRRKQEAKANELSAQARSLSESSGGGVSHGTGRGPVAGSVLVNWHETTESGPATGITYNARPSSTVRAPCSGQIDFAGPFRSFGNMIILDCGRHFRFVLAGLDQISIANGQNVTKNAVLGGMSSNGGKLFVQLRSGSQSVDPRPYL